MLRYLFLVLVLATAPASSSVPCPQGRNPMTLCKHCKDLTTVTHSFKPVGGVGCQLGCAALCGWKPSVQAARPSLVAGEPAEQPDPRRDPMRGLDPSILEGFYDAEGKYCGPIPYMKPWNFYALEATDAQIMELAKQSPAAAMHVVTARAEGVGSPAPLEIGESTLTAIANAGMVELLLRGEEDAAVYAKVAPPLEGDIGFLTRTRVERLRNGNRLVVIETELLHHPTLSTVGMPYPPYAVEIERVVGKTVPAELPENPARVWRVVSWGNPESYYR